MKKTILIACFFFLTGCTAKQTEDATLADEQKAKPAMDLIFSRDYSQAHLNSNRKQVVKRIIVRIESESIDKSLESEPDAYGWVYAKFTNLPSWYMQVLRCTKISESNSYHCYTDSDGGGFNLKVEVNNRAVLQDKDRVRMEKCGIEWSGSEDEDKSASLSKYEAESFILESSPKIAFNETLKNSKCDTVEG